MHDILGFIMQQMKSFVFFLIRENGVIFAITFWQWLVEGIFNFCVVVFLAFLKGHNRTFDHVIILLFFHLVYIILPSFYFIADKPFRRDLRTDGLCKALWKVATNTI